MSIVCLGWGSLLWDPRELPADADWSHDGPQLPIEFARQSGDGRITLVVTPGAAPIKVFSAPLTVSSIDDARYALAEREGVSSRFVSRSVGFWTRESGSDHPERHAVACWASEAEHDGVVWTALKPKFGNDYVTPTCEQVVSYLDGLAGETREKAETYVRRTPVQVRTSYRETIHQVLGWMPSDD